MSLKKINNAIYLVSGLLAAALLLGIVITVLLQVFSRYVLHITIRWTSELVVYLMTWMVFTACSMGYRKDEIVGMTTVTDRLAPAAQQVARILVAVLLIFFFTVTTVANQEIIVYGTQKFSTILNLRMSYVYGMWSVAACIMTLYAIEKIIDSARMLATGCKVKAGDKGGDTQ